MKFYQLSPEQRRKILADESIQLEKINPAELDRLDQLSENVIGEIRLPLSIVQNLIINGEYFHVPMATEEPSVVAAANHGAHLFALNNGVQATSNRNGIWGQIVLKVDASFDKDQLEPEFPALIAQANHKFASLIRHGGGVKKIVAHQQGDLLYLRVLVDPAEAMGANKTNSILEYLAPKMLAYRGIKGKLFAILSNYPSQIATAEAKLSFKSLGGQEVAQRIALLSQIAHDDVYRAVTNNKGIMNGVDAVLLATGNDYRAVEAACGVWASRSGQYCSLSSWQVKNDFLVGKLTLPLAIGTVGGSISARQDIKQSFSILGRDINSDQLAKIIVSIGLANNLAAMLAISTTGIQAGHMKLQARNIVNSLSATPKEKEAILKLMIEHKAYSQTKAKNFLEKLREEK